MENVKTEAVLPTLCNRCGHVMWYDETKKKWYCSNPKCKKYKPQPDNTENVESEAEDG